MTDVDVLIDAYDRVGQELPRLLVDLKPDELLWRPGPDANPIAWLAWHIDRGQDAQLAPLAGLDQAWDQGWRERFALPYPAEAMGYGQSSRDVAAFDVTDVDLLLGYHRSVEALAHEVLEAERGKDLSRIVDTRWDPPVTAAVRLVSVVNDASQHLGQLAYVKGLLATR
ncbi:MAG: DinB family protein [Propionibacterium sp.]